jgi:hypothetical protein
MPSWRKNTLAQEETLRARAFWLSLAHLKYARPAE